MNNILIVEDELDIAEVLRLILEDQGYIVSCAANGLKGLQQVAENRPDLILLDHMMPKMTGAEMAQVLRSADPTRRIVIVFSSALDEATVRRHFDDYDAFLQKPYTIDKALNLIGSLLDRKASREEARPSRQPSVPAMQH